MDQDLVPFCSAPSQHLSQLPLILGDVQTVTARLCQGGGSNSKAAAAQPKVTRASLLQQPSLAPQASGECAPSGKGCALLTPRASPATHSQLRQVPGAPQAVEGIQGPCPGAAKPRGAHGAASLRTGCGAGRGQHQRSQQAS